MLICAIDGAGAGGGGGGGGGKVKRQVWTATAIEAFSEGLCQVGSSFYILDLEPDRFSLMCTGFYETTCKPCEQKHQFVVMYTVFVCDSKFIEYIIIHKYIQCKYM